MSLGWWDSTKMASKMAYEWALGAGPDHMDFGPDSQRVLNMMDAVKVNQACNDFYKKAKEKVAHPTISELNQIGEEILLFRVQIHPRLTFGLNRSTFLKCNE